MSRDNTYQQCQDDSGRKTRQFIRGDLGVEPRQRNDGDQEGREADPNDQYYRSANCACAYQILDHPRQDLIDNICVAREQVQNTATRHCSNSKKSFHSLQI